MSKKRKQPLYDQLVELLKEQIETELEPHTMLPSERELVDKYGLSRTTVRLALQELEKMGYIYRQHGKGTFVSAMNQQATNLSGSYSFTEQMRSLGKQPETKILAYHIIEANKFFAEHLGVNLGEKLIKLKRLRLADGMPMMVERSYLPYRKFMQLTEAELEEKPLYELFSEDYNETIKLADEEFYASIVRENDATLLDIHAGAPCLNLIRTTYNLDNEIIEFTLSVARSDQFRYKIRHVR